jgi:four helix bundle protein
MDFKQLDIWKRAYALNLSTYRILPNIPDFEKTNIIDQMRRAVTSIPSNIAEGCGSISPKSFRCHLVHSYKSLYELENLLLLCRDLSYLDPDEFAQIYDELENFKTLFSDYIEELEKKIPKSRYRFRAE